MSPYDVVKSRRMMGTELTRAARQVGPSVDVKNLVGLALSTAAKVAAAKPAGFMHTLRNGTLQRVIVFNLADGQRVSSLQFAVPPKGTAASRAFLARKDGAEWVVTKASEGGALWRVIAGSRQARSSGIRTKYHPVGVMSFRSQQGKLSTKAGVYWDERTDRLW